jgi:hypothetical protein
MPPFVKTANNVEFYHLTYKIGDFMHQKADITHKKSSFLTRIKCIGRNNALFKS